jgi:hypothetical protein
MRGYVNRYQCHLLARLVNPPGQGKDSITWQTLQHASSALSGTYEYAVRNHVKCCNGIAVEPCHQSLRIKSR